MLIQFLKNCLLTVVENFDEETETVDEADHSFGEGEQVDVDLLPCDSVLNCVNIQFGDGSVAYGVPCNLFKEVKAPTDLKQHEMDNLGQICFGCANRYDQRSIRVARCEACQKSVYGATLEDLLKEFAELDNDKQKAIIKTLNSRPIDENEMSNRLHAFIDDCDMDDLTAMFKDTFACVEDMEEDDMGEPIVVFDREIGEKW